MNSLQRLRRRASQLAVRLQKRDRPRIYLFTYHKTSTVLLTKIFQDICKVWDWKLQILLLGQTQVWRHTDVALFHHSLVDVRHLPRPYRGVRFIRDPRDIIVSGYLYHCRTNERWCIEENYDLTPTPVSHPSVPHAQSFPFAEWKRQHLDPLEGKSYREIVSSLPQRDGLLFEMEYAGAWTIEAIRQWHDPGPGVLTFGLEAAASDFDRTFRAVFAHLGFSEAEIAEAVAIASAHDMNHFSEQKLTRVSHISSRKVTKWMDYFEDVHKARFREKFGTILQDLGYERDDNW